MDKKRRVPELQMLGAALYVLRREKGMTQRQLAEACGLHRVQVSKIERGVHAIDTLTLVRLGTAIPLPTLLRGWANMMEI